MQSSFENCVLNPSLKTHKIVKNYYDSWTLTSLRNPSYEIKTK